MEGKLLGELSINYLDSQSTLINMFLLNYADDHWLPLELSFCQYLRRCSTGFRKLLLCLAYVNLKLTSINDDIASYIQHQS